MSVDISKFYRHLADNYREQRRQAECQNSVLWDIAIGLIRQIAEAELDGSSIKSLKAYGEEQAQTLRDLIDPPSMMELLRKQTGTLND